MTGARDELVKSQREYIAEQRKMIAHCDNLNEMYKNKLLLIDKLIQHSLDENDRTPLLQYLSDRKKDLKDSRNTNKGESYARST